MFELTLLFNFFNSNSLFGAICAGLVLVLAPAYTLSPLATFSKNLPLFTSLFPGTIRPVLSTHSAFLILGNFTTQLVLAQFGPLCQSGYA
jgi:hypothetical protein